MPPTKTRADAAVPPGSRFKAEIAAALAAGSSVDALVLRLTHMDASKIKRDSDIALEDVNFSSGEMRFLGVRVLQGDIASSRLGDATELPTRSEPGRKPTKAKTAPASASAVKASAAKSREAKA